MLPRTSLDAICSIKYKNYMPKLKANKTEVNNRQNRLKAALKANVGKRKAQVKARAVSSLEKVSRKD